LFTRSIPLHGSQEERETGLSGASLAGVLAGHVVSASTWYPAPNGARDGLQHAGVSLITKMGVDVFKEFRPRRSK
jgi:hypothetical protein